MSPPRGAQGKKVPPHTHPCCPLGPLGRKFSALAGRSLVSGGPACGPPPAATLELSTLHLYWGGQKQLQPPMGGARGVWWGVLTAYLGHPSPTSGLREHSWCRKDGAGPLGCPPAPPQQCACVSLPGVCPSASTHWGGGRARPAWCGPVSVGCPCVVPPQAMALWGCFPPGFAFSFPLPGCRTGQVGALPPQTPPDHHPPSTFCGKLLHVRALNFFSGHRVLNLGGALGSG